MRENDLHLMKQGEGEGEGGECDLEGWVRVPEILKGYAAKEVGMDCLNFSVTLKVFFQTL